MKAPRAHLFMFYSTSKLLRSRKADQTLFSGAVMVGLGTLGVKGVAFLKELVVAHEFGTSDQVDAYVFAMLIPSILALALGNAFRDAFLPVYSDRKLNASGTESALASSLT